MFDIKQPKFKSNLKNNIFQDNITTIQFDSYMIKEQAHQLRNPIVLNNDSFVKDQNKTISRSKSVARSQYTSTSLKPTPRPSVTRGLPKDESYLVREQPSIGSQLLQILEMGSEAERDRTYNVPKLLKPKIEKGQHALLFERLHKLFDLYIQEQILKHYCLKSGWKISKQFLNKLVLPAFDLLAINKQKISPMFQPFLKSLTVKYILHTELDTYSRMSQQLLLIEITQVWIRIKQAEIEAKRSMRALLPYFKLNYCKNVNGKLVMNRSALFNSMFSNPDQMRIVGLIKIFIFSYKVQGEKNQTSIDNWLEQY